MRRLFALPLVLFSCSPAPDGGPSPSPAASVLPVGVVAKVGNLSIAEESVASVSNALQVPPRNALDREIHDALFANAALTRGYEAHPAVRAALRGHLARVVLEELKKQTTQRAIDDAEVAEATARHFVELDRPEAFRVIHALVKIPETAPPARRAQAKALAERLAAQVAPARDPDDFRVRVESVADRDGFEIVVETLKPVAADGRVVDIEHPSAEPQQYVLPFARAASHLGEPGQKSGVVPTDFGFHVLLLIEKTAPHTVPLNQRRDLLREEILTERARRVKKDVLQSLRAAFPPDVERSADSLLASIDLGEHAH